MTLHQQSVAEVFEAEPPHDRAAEAALLGSILHDAAVLPSVAATVHEDQLWVVRHQGIYRAMLDAYTRHDGTVNMVTLSTLLKDRGIFKQVGGLDYLMELTESVPHGLCTPAYAEIVVEKAKSRRLITVLSSGVKHALGCHQPVSELIHELRGDLIKLGDDSDHAVSVPIGQDIDQFVANFQQWAKTGEDTDALRYGLTDLDRMLGGARPGQLIVLAAATGVGKTALGLQFARTWAESGHPVAIFSLEMPRQQLQERLLASIAGVSLNGLTRRSTPNTDELEKVIAAKDRLADLPMHICDATSLTPAKLADTARLLRDQSGIKMLVIDYLQLLDFERRENRNVEVAGVTRAVKTLALEMNVPILLLSQLNRDSTREKRRPRLHDLRDSGAIEQDADVVLFLHDPERVKDSPGPGYFAEPARDLELIVAKQRQGPLGAFSVRFDGERQQFSNIEAGYMS